MKKVFIFIGGVVSGIVILCGVIARVSYKSDRIKNLIVDWLYDKLVLASKRPENKQRAVSYRSYYDKKANGDVKAYFSDDIYHVDPYIFASKKDATEIVYEIQDVVKGYGVVTVAEFKELCGAANINYVDNKYGWSESHIDRINIVRVKCGYELYMPDPILL